MRSLFGRSARLDWPAIADALALVETITEQVLVKKRSRDLCWHSPILNAEPRSCFGDLVTVPKTPDEMAYVLSVA